MPCFLLMLSSYVLPSTSSSRTTTNRTTRITLQTPGCVLSAPLKKKNARYFCFSSVSLSIEMRSYMRVISSFARPMVICIDLIGSFGTRNCVFALTRWFCSFIHKRQGERKSSAPADEPSRVRDSLQSERFKKWWLASITVELLLTLLMDWPFY